MLVLKSTYCPICDKSFAYMVDKDCVIRNCERCGHHLVLHNIPKDEDDDRITVVCRLCREEWLYPPQYAEQFDSEYDFECSYCRGRMRRMKKLFGG